MIRRLIFISSMGIYGDVPGERYSSVLDPYRDSAAGLVYPSRGLTLADAGRLLPDHSHVDPEITVRAINNHLSPKPICIRWLDS
ncbi:MAG TPA: hypothetical protein VL354_11045 [Spirochaetia bacterium]|nr:hypothetical protein [Spirochaetia bacterium]